jgi:transcription initiation factor IIE alpha subunit
LADALGLSAVHVNRVLRDLREDNLVTFRNGRVDLTDFNGLVAYSGTCAHPFRQHSPTCSGVFAHQ